MTKRIANSILIAALAAYLLCFCFMLGRQREISSALLRRSLDEEAAMIAAGVQSGGDGYLAALDTQRRVCRRGDGGVIWENGAAWQTDNLLTGAAALSDGTEIRVQAPPPGISDILSEMFVPALVGAALILLLALLLSRGMSKKIVAPINAIDPEKPDKDGHYPEIQPLLHKITRQNELIRKQMDDLRRHQEEFRAITENMDEGFILVDRKTEILSYNASALRLLGRKTDSGAVFALNRSPAFLAAVGEALTGTHNEKVLETNGRVYQLIANPVTEHGQTDGAVVIILDATEKRQREQMRREFTSNVSHELKTPLTSVYGISDILMNGLVKPEDVPKFASDIHHETGRLISLVEDTIRLSQLDEDSIPYERERIDLYAVAAEVAARLRPSAVQHEVELTLSGETCVVTGIEPILSEIISNLCDNAIKYNRPGGSVRVCVTEEDGHPTVTVADTGIGIPKEHLDRVFERFYRVDKSHSKEIGGTGLGLSIVKHGAAYHNADVKIESELGAGTTVKIVF